MFTNIYPVFGRWQVLISFPANDDTTIQNYINVCPTVISSLYLGCNSQVHGGKKNLAKGQLPDLKKQSLMLFFL